MLIQAKRSYKAAVYAVAALAVSVQSALAGSPEPGDDPIGEILDLIDLDSVYTGVMAIVAVTVSIVVLRFGVRLVRRFLN